MVTSLSSVCLTVKQNMVLKRNGGAAVVSRDTIVPEFGRKAAYTIIEPLDLKALNAHAQCELFTLPLPLPCNNYPMLFAPEQRPDANQLIRNSLPLNQAVPDFNSEHSRQYEEAINLGDWIKAKGSLVVTQLHNNQDAEFDFDLSNLVPSSLYTIMALREHDLNPEIKSRPGPLGVPNCFVTDSNGHARYKRIIKNPFPKTGGNRIINVVVLFMSSQCSHGGAIGEFGLGGDIHAHLKLTTAAFHEFVTEGSLN